MKASVYYFLTSYFKPCYFHYSAELVSSPKALDTSDNTDHAPVILPDPTVLLRGGGEEVVGYGLRVEHHTDSPMLIEPSTNVHGVTLR